MFTIHSDSLNDNMTRDEIKAYLDARYVSALEAYARIMGWPTHSVCIMTCVLPFLDKLYSLGISRCTAVTSPSRK